MQRLPRFRAPTPALPDRVNVGRCIMCSIRMLLRARRVVVIWG